MNHRDTETQRFFWGPRSMAPCLCVSVVKSLCVSVVPGRMSQLYALRDFCRANRDWLVETTEALVRLESPTTATAAVDRLGRELASRLEAIGGRVARLSGPDRGDHLLAEFGCGASQILLLGHFDTVWPVGQIDRMPLVQRGHRLHGP